MKARAELPTPCLASVQHGQRREERRQQKQTHRSGAMRKMNTCEACTLASEHHPSTHQSQEESGLHKQVVLPGHGWACTILANRHGQSLMARSERIYRVKDAISIQPDFENKFSSRGRG